MLSLPRFQSLLQPMPGHTQAMSDLAITRIHIFSLSLQPLEMLFPYRRGPRTQVDLDKLEKPLLASEVATVIILALVWVLGQKYSMKSVFTVCLLRDSAPYTVFAPCGGQNIKSQRQGFPGAHSWLTQRYKRQLRSRLGNLIQSGKESAPVLDCDA